MPNIGEAGWTEIHRAVPIIDRISAFQVHRIHQQTPLRYSPAPCVCPISSGISRYRNIPTASRAHSPVRPLFSIKTLSNRAIKSALPCFQCPPRRIPILAPPHHFFMEPGLHQVADYRGKRDLTEIYPVVPIIHGISPFQIHRIHLETYLQYFPDPCVLPTCPGISRYRITLHNRPQSAQSRNPFSPSTHGPIHS